MKTLRFLRAPSTPPGPPVEAALGELFMRFPSPVALVDRNGNALFMNREFEKRHGPGAIAADCLRALPSGAGGMPQAMSVVARDGSIVQARIMEVGGGEHFAVLVDGGDDGELLGTLAFLRSRVSELERQATTDHLTGAWNRAHFERVVGIEIDRSNRYRQPVSLILLDVDHFKRINDGFGHDAGDAVLRDLTRLAGDGIRSTDMLFRWGGEEFAVLASTTGYRGAAALAETLRRLVERHGFPAVGSLTISLGVAEHAAGEDAAAWFRRADAALYEAKHGGRNRLCVDRLGCSDLWAADRGRATLGLLWHEAYECGDPTIDGEHRQLFVLANELISATIGSQAGPEAGRKALDRLTEHLVRHFSDEEAILERLGYPGLGAHKRAHEGLVRRALELKSMVKAGKGGLGELVEFLADDVVAGHLFKMDREFYPLLGQVTWKRE